MSFTSFLVLLSLLNFHQFLTAENLDSPRRTSQTYIVHVDMQSDDIESWYNSFLPTDVAASNHKPQILHRYRNVFSGFAAKLSADDVKTMEQKTGFISARPERILPLHTTHSPNFLGLNQNLGFWNVSNYGKGVIIGLLDTGILPDHPSFSDEGLLPPPAKWKGECQFSSRACNNKVIGARYFRSGDGSRWMRMVMARILLVQLLEILPDVPIYLAMLMARLLGSHLMLIWQFIKGKIVLCQIGGSVRRTEKGEAVKNAGGAAMILLNQEPQGYTTQAEAHVLPAAQISYADALKIKAYLDSTSRPTARILYKGTVIGDDRAPVVAGFSSRGPSLVTPGILKPDIIGPGVNILAAWPVSVDNQTRSKSTYNMISGTSMSCPHLSGVAALLKSAHPDWTPAAIKSAIVTTADQTNLGGNPIQDERFLPADIFATGPGHVNPSRANDPGLIYDIQPNDYIPYLCGLNYTNQQVSLIVQQRVDCSRVSSIPEAQLNYPAFSIVVGSTPQTYTRTVTNVGEPKSLYNVQIVSPAGVVVKVEPARLSFSRLGQKLRYSVTFTRSAARVKSVVAQGSINWNSGAKRSVRSPIAVVFGR
ncbi:UNVERIFIED_CONTAM: Subtilisin-like protease SBT1.2 [Sesamum angustifolium]|uniref:Subtilisin-like protease SBT1.2 n=1 Tax=Sesamum angustifolium TaxID=2727405 RepID=A0AAW2J2T4_9LAMI